MKLLGWFVMTAMLTAIGYGIANASFFDQGSELLSLVWGRVTLVDLYLMLATFAGWIWWRERSPVRSLLWTVALFTLGSAAAGAYLISAARRAGSAQAVMPKTPDLGQLRSSHPI